MKTSSKTVSIIALSLFVAGSAFAQSTSPAPATTAGSMPTAPAVATPAPAPAAKQATPQVAPVKRAPVVKTAARPQTKVACEAAVVKHWWLGTAETGVCFRTFREYAAAKKAQIEKLIKK